MLQTTNGVCRRWSLTLLKVKIEIVFGFFVLVGRVDVKADLVGGHGQLLVVLDLAILVLINALCEPT